MAPPCTYVSNNHKSVNDHSDVIQNHIEKSLLLDRIAGPFLEPPFVHFVSSPLGIVPKSEPGKFRIIHDLSYSKNASVNSGVPKENSQVHYDSIDDIVRLVFQCGSGCLMAKTDIKGCFQNSSYHPLDYHLLGFSWNGNYYFDKCLPMGASSSCQIF